MARLPRISRREREQSLSHRHVSSRSNKPHLDLRDFQARISEQLVIAFIARRVSPM